jgi:lysophospholipase L1-like esterase
VKFAGDNFFIADLFNSRLNNDFYYNNTLDGLHPDEDGMHIIAEVIERSFKLYYK